MPELPEVETIRRNIARVVKGKCIRRLDVLRPDMVKREIAPPLLSRRTRNRVITAVKRRGKALLIFLDNSDVLVFRLGMTGQILWSNPRHPVCRDKHTHIIIHCGRGERVLFRDSRRFGEIYLIEKDRIENVLCMGAEPLCRNFTPALLNSIADSRVRIKQLLMDQRRIAGIGNIYADEILFEAGIHPCTPAHTIQGLKLTKLHQSICAILREAIACRGDTVSDYRTAFGESGSYQCRHRVYRRKGEPCIRCGAPIQRIRLGGRSCHFCPLCQKPGRGCSNNLKENSIDKEHK